MRDYHAMQKFGEALSQQDTRKVVERLKEGDLDYDITLDQAVKYEVRVSGKMRTLGWIAQNKPKRLELLMQTIEPGSPLFTAVTLVYNANIDAVLTDVTEENERIRDAGMEGLDRYKKEQAAIPPMKVRPVKMRVRPVGRRRVFLRE